MSKSTFLVALTMAYTIPSVLGHMAMWDPSVYGFTGSGAKMIEPLHGMPFEQWWFHNEITAHPPAPGKIFDLPAGGTAVAQIACEQRWTKHGGNPDPNNSPCPSDPAAAHAGLPPKDSSMRGCGLAIAYKSDARDVKKEDFVIFSVNHACVKTRDTNFPVPKGMKACPNGKCICAWFWQGFESNDEMYMNGFDCKISNPGTLTLAPPKAPKPCHGNPSACVRGAKNPMYWANLDKSNIEYFGRNKLPAYNDDWGFPNGAQNDIFLAAPAPPPPPPPPAPAPAPAPVPVQKPVVVAAPPPAPVPVAGKPNQTVKIMPDGSKVIIETVVETVVVHVQGKLAKAKARRAKRAAIDIAKRAVAEKVRRGRIPTIEEIRARGGTGQRRRR
ncbi:hypothetical protein DFH27DRAFT_358925 [Peziza echinospora]|nr:hypothetical protein DFH27DRAFT_358925 [Peziza echinospora]